jgi:hypothetical protein
VFCRRRQALANEQPAWKLGDLRRTPNPFGIRAQKRKHIAKDGLGRAQAGSGGETARPI